LAHLDGRDGVLGGDLLDCLATLIYSMAILASNSGLLVRHLLIGVSPFRDSTPAQRLTMGPPQKK
jgi:hypothetical protein